MSLAYQNVTTAEHDPAQLNPDLKSMFANMSGDSHLEVRASYFNLCVSRYPGVWVCGSRGSDLARQLTSEDDPENLIWLCAQFKDGLISSGLV